MLAFPCSWFSQSKLMSPSARFGMSSRLSKLILLSFQISLEDWVGVLSPSASVTFQSTRAISFEFAKCWIPPSWKLAIFLAFLRIVMSSSLISISGLVKIGFRDPKVSFQLVGSLGSVFWLGGNLSMSMIVLSRFTLSRSILKSFSSVSL